MKTQFLPNYAIPPGSHIKEAMKELGMNQRYLSYVLNEKPSFVRNLINGKQEITPNTARLLEMLLKIPASFWLNAEIKYREHKKRIETEHELNRDKTAFYERQNDRHFTNP